MEVLLPHRKGMPAAWWREWMDDGSAIIWVRCVCGIPTSLGKHRVAPDGRVTPQVRCTECKRAADVWLAGWSEARK